MRITPEFIAKQVVESVVLDPGPCIYPSGFKPPHIGHFEVLKDLVSRSYITEVFVVISPKTRGGISAEQSLKAWQTYLECQPLQKVQVEIAPYPSPVLYAYKFIEARPDQKPIYIAGGKDDVEDQNYFQSLHKRFGDQVLTIAVDEKARGMSGTDLRAVLKSGDYEKFKKSIPGAVTNKGRAAELFKILAPAIKESIQPGTRLREKSIEEFVEFCSNILVFENRPVIECHSNKDFATALRSFGCYSPSEAKIDVYVGNRNLADILRTLAHELIHHKQNELQNLYNGAGETGSEVENEANAGAAMIMRKYGAINPAIYE
jgi:nicotinic acid mononucleotide adenylyltransferase